MPKKFSGGNSKAEAAKEKKASAKAEQSTKVAKAEDDAYWDEAGDGKKGKAAAKKAEEAKRKEEAAAKKAEAKRLAEQEEAELAKQASKKLGKVAAPKVTQHQLRLQSEAERKAQDAETEKQRAQRRREISEDEYARMVEVENRNKEDAGAVDARSVEAALSMLTTEEKEEKHPEKRAKAAWNAYYEAELPNLRAEKPGLKLQQYKDLLWKSWQKSPDNPFNQVQK